MLSLLFFAVVGHAWVTDDAFIDFRTVKNFIAGNGLRFNVDERVQSFSEPLWFFLLAGGNALGFNLYFWAMILGALCTGATLFLLWKIFGKRSNNILNFLVIGVLLGFSDTFLSFQTCGLGNSLSTLLIVCLFASASRRNSGKDLFRTIVLGTLLAFNRLDQCFIIFPTVILCLWNVERSWTRKFAITLAGLTPLILWEIFSVIYFGFLFPNTKYAKIGGRSLFDSIFYGFHYLADFAQFEPLQFLALIGFPILVIFLHRRKIGLSECISIGVLLQVLYVVLEGGDFMRGRFLESSLVGVSYLFLLFMSMLPPITVNRFDRAILTAVLCIGALYAFIVRDLHVPGELEAVTNERNFYKEYLALHSLDLNRYQQHPWARWAYNVNRTTPPGSAILFMTGQTGYYITPDIDVVDLLHGISDAFVARMPCSDTKRTGHFLHTVPEEYSAERTSRQKQSPWKDVKAEALWRDLQLITQSEDLFSKRRWEAMLRVWKEYGM